MKALVEILQEHHQISAAVFRDRYPYPVLIHRIRGADRINLSAETQFARPLSGDTSTMAGAMLSLGLDNAKALVHLDRVVGSLGARGTQSITDGSIVVFPPTRPPGPTGLPIGRASDAAYCLPYPKISKIHAYLRQHAPSGRWILVDGGSRNGTQIGGAPVPGGNGTDISDGALIQLSQYQFLFYTPVGFYRILGDE